MAINLVCSALHCANATQRFSHSPWPSTIAIVLQELRLLSRVASASLFHFQFSAYLLWIRTKKRERKNNAQHIIIISICKNTIKKRGRRKKPLLKPRNQSNCYCKFVCTVWHVSSRSLNMVLMSRCFFVINQSSR